MSCVFPIPRSTKNIRQTTRKIRTQVTRNWSHNHPHGSEMQNTQAEVLHIHHGPHNVPFPSLARLACCSRNHSHPHGSEMQNKQTNGNASLHYSSSVVKPVSINISCPGPSNELGRHGRHDPYQLQNAESDKDGLGVHVTSLYPLSDHHRSCVAGFGSRLILIYSNIV